MKKRIFCLLFIFITTYQLIAHEILCGGVEGSLKSDILIPNSNNYIPNSNTQTKIIRVNIHFITLESGASGYPGNFTEYDDGNGNTNYTGFNYASDLIDMANYQIWANHNTQMYLPPGNQTPTLDWKYYFTLNGVFFHENNSLYFFDRFPSYTDWIFGKDIGYAINLYLVHSDPNDRAGGVATMNGDRCVKICRAWELYNQQGSSNSLNSRAQCFLHETGHSLSLLHTMMGNNGNCCLTYDDYCSDTPTMGEIINVYGFDPCNNIWGCSGNCSNNLMDYSGQITLTPE
jgi:hypothetical protein